MNHDFRTRNNFCRWSLLVALALVSLGVQAQTVIYDRFKTSSGIEIATGPEYVPKTVDQARGQAIWNNAVGLNGGMPEVSGDHVPRNSSGNPVEVKAKASIPGPEVGKAVGRAIGRLATKLAVPLVVGMELYDLAKEIGMLLERNPDGSIKVTKEDPTICTVSPCYEYRLASVTPWFSTRQAAADAWVAYKNSTSSTEQWRVNGVSDTGGSGFGIAYTQYALNSSPSNWVNSEKWFGQQSASPSATSMVPSTQQEFLDAVAAKSGWPSTSAINSVLKNDLSTGGVVKTGPITVSGPATSQGTTRTTNNTTNNTTRTDTTTHNHNYAGNTMTTTNVYNSTVINNTTGDTISNETTTEVAKGDPVKEDQCATYPDSLGCSELGDQEETPMPTKTENITFTPVAFQSNATCPPPLAITGSLPMMGSFNYSLSYSGICDGAGIIRLFLLAGAALVGIGIFVGGLKS